MVENLSWTERTLLTTILGGVVGLVVFDVWTDWNAGASINHLGTETFVALLALSGIAFIWSRNFSLTHQVKQLDRELERARVDVLRWKSENASLLRGLGEAIEKQLADWGLTSAEKDIATLLLKGLSLKEIAEARNTSERTVRQQTVALYSKSGLAGRAELAAFFLEDLFAPVRAPEG
jgi:DNA-binding CsgD family transcriptional regulator